MAARGGTTKYWTEAQEREYELRLAACKTFAERHLLMSIRDLVKYDGRTKEGKRAIAQGRLRLAIATDEDLEELVRLEAQMPGRGNPGTMSNRLKELKELRQSVRDRGIKEKEITG